jgi:Resolvase, N terminal domain
MRTALYLRVSTSHQKLDLQADSLRHYATHAGLEIIAEYVDVAVSGRKEGRPQLQALMRAARHHEFACVLVWKFDRFARSVSHLLSALEEFHHLGIRFISVQDQVDTESPIGKAMFTVIGAMAELEYSSDHGCPPRQSQPVGRGAHREACPKPVKRGIAVTGFYTYPEQTPWWGRPAGGMRLVRHSHRRDLWAYV